jgi:fumarate reductase flavoprotein subunit
MTRNALKCVILGTLLVFLVSTGCDNTTNTSGSEDRAAVGVEVMSDVYDVIVVGVGSSGHAAMVAAVDTGAKVIAVEQAAFAFPMMSAGIGAAESTQQKAARDEGNPSFRWFTKDTLFNTLFEYSHYTANGPLVRRIVDESGENLDWLAARGLTTTLQLGSDQGMHITDEYLQTYHMHNFGWMTLQSYFTQIPGVGFDGSPSVPPPLPAGAQPGTLRLNTRVIDLLLDGDGKVAGILAEDVNDHHPVVINGKSVILCTGGYGPATDKFKELLELENLEFYAYGGEGNTGSGIEMAVNKAGAKLWGDHSFMLHNNVARHTDGSPGNDLAGSPLFFLYNWEAIPAVNTEGRRFMNEKLVSNSALWANASYSQGGTYFIVFSKNILDDLENEGITQDMWYIGAVSQPGSAPNPSPFTAPTQAEIDSAMAFGLMAGVFQVNSGHPVNKDRFNGGAQAAADGNTLKSITQAAADFAAQGFIYSGATVEELARNAGMSDPSVLVNTINKYNTAVETGLDTEFGKSANYLQKKLTTGPYYAMRLSLSSLGGSSGGVMVDSNLQVLDTNYHTISGLYAAGLNAGGFYGPVSTYYDYEGSAMMFATNSGRIAGTEAGNAHK